MRRSSSGTERLDLLVPLLMEINALAYDGGITDALLGMSRLFITLVFNVFTLMFRYWDGFHN